MTLSHILVPTDFSAPSDAALEYAQLFARSFGASIHVLHVVENPLAMGTWSSGVSAELAGVQNTLIADASVRLQRSLAHTRAVTSEVRSGAAAAEILTCAGERGVDLIVMGTHGRTGFAHVMMGSVAERVVRQAGCPVVTLRGPATPAARAAG